MSALFAVGYGLLSYAVFVVSFLYAVGFVGNMVVPKSIDVGAGGAPLAQALIVDLLLLGLFAVQHSVMARPAFKRWWTSFVPKSVERSTYVLFASLTLLLLYWQWQPMAGTVWNVGNPLAVLALKIVFWCGFALAVASTFLIDHFELFGLSQVFARVCGREPAQPVFRTPLLYRHVRHPLYLGFLLAFWAAPVMSIGHLLFALATSGYILIGIYFEERDLIDQFGDRYRRYRERVSMLLPLPGRKARRRSSLEKSA
jgi:protein-S-isoprenylcysteine O-methyltransferase Ste14